MQIPENTFLKYNGVTYSSDTAVAGAQAHDRLAGLNGQNPDAPGTEQSKQDMLEDVRGWSENHAGATVGDFKSYEEDALKTAGWSKSEVDDLVNSVLPDQIRTLSTWSSDGYAGGGGGSEPVTDSTSLAAIFVPA